MKVLVLGADGYLGWPTCMYMAQHGHEVAALDNFSKRMWEMEVGVEPLMPVAPLHTRVNVFQEKTGKQIELYAGDLTNPRYVYKAFAEFRPDAIIHFGEQPSAPYSMRSRANAVYTQQNNIVGTLNVLFAMQQLGSEAHLIKLGTMGEYGTPNIDIEEGYIEIEHKGRRDTLPFPKQPGSFYHLSKVHDSNNLMFACKIWGMRATDLNQGVVYGMETDETALDPRLCTSFHYDEVFGTALNRFCVQAIAGKPLTLYGKGLQKRGFLNIRDTLRCVELAMLNPAEPGRMRVFNQFTEVFTVSELAERVKAAAATVGIKAEIAHVENPRIEAEEHYYNPTHSKLPSLGLEPKLLDETLVESMLNKIKAYKEHINTKTLQLGVKWRQRAANG